MVTQVKTGDPSREARSGDVEHEDGQCTRVYITRHSCVRVSALRGSFHRHPDSPYCFALDSWVWARAE